ncbi:hypothetical protein MATL_G00195200 [Megalops atlanticus]|uniref:E3 ubiquitin/ISG15 ligase TRIM25-like n=1 Tax=Megalops atlanticus TaxID=7932 RepID=A0A9D3PJD0_MEGAT|nr:hypothetical protein MATL_G00195200 [Megalops atlanticus]
MSVAGNVLSEVQFQCSICLDIFTSPVSTPCGHTFCLVCIGGYWDSTNLCQCPLCKETFEKRPKLCINRSFAEITELFKKTRDSSSEQRSAGPGEVACDVCTGLKLKAVKSCLVCLASYCDKHITSHSARFTKHKLVDPVRDLEDRMCKKHERLLELFCKSDQACVCVLCSKTDHRAHSIVSMEDAVQELKTQLGKSEEEIQHMIQDRQKKVEEIKQSLKLSKSSAESEIADSMQVFFDLVSYINRSQAELIEMIEEKQKAAESQAERLIAALDQEIIELKKRNSEMEQLSHAKDCIHFLQSFPSLSTPPHTKDWSDLTVHTELCVGTIRVAVSHLEEQIEKLKRKLSETELRQIQQNAVDVTLDPSTANRWLVLSEDGKQPLYQ